MLFFRFAHNADERGLHFFIQRCTVVDLFARFRCHRDNKELTKGFSPLLP